MRVGSFVFTPLEIRHKILKCPLSDEGFLEEKMLEEIDCEDPKNEFVYPKENPLINFGFYFPHKANPPLKIYDANNVEKELKAVANRVFSTSMLEKNNCLQLPALMKSYKKSYGENHVECIKEWLPEKMLKNHKKLLDTWYDF